MSMNLDKFHVWMEVKRKDPAFMDAYKAHVKSVRGSNVVPDSFADWAYGQYVEYKKAEFNKPHR